MLRYDWSRPVLRLIWGAVLSAGFVVSRHYGSKYSLIPPDCNGDLLQGLTVFTEFLFICCAIEGANWVWWYAGHRQELGEARNSDDNPEDYTLSGGGILGVGNKIGNLLLGIGLAVLGGKLGPNPCTSQGLAV